MLRVERLVRFRHQSVHAWPDYQFRSNAAFSPCRGDDRSPDTTEEDTMIDQEIFAA
jgi:hypothetical protein